MQKTALLALSASFLSTTAFAQTAPMTVNVAGIENDKLIAEKFAFCAPDGKGKTKDGGNVNPAVSWSGAPAGTQSYAIIVVDKDVPAKFDDANKEGKIIAGDFPRQDFYHWALVDIPATLTGIAEGQDSEGLVPDGKPTGKTAYGINGQNDFASFLKGTFGGYDGPCPPWNDERLHHYHFIVYALGVPSLGLKENFTGKQAMEAIDKHTLARGEMVGTFTNKQ
jgi:Raf kinase inhibitor-like YbhB/YbcL family protein